MAFHMLRRLKYPCRSVLVITILCAFVSCVAGGAIAWPGALTVSTPNFNTIIPGETKTTAYSTSQYINAVPTSYSMAAHPQFAFNVPQVNTFASLQPPYYAVGPSYIPAANIFYPSTPAYSPIFGTGFPAAPIAPAYPSSPPSGPSPISPAFPEGAPSESSTPAPGDADSAVIDSADVKPEQEMRQDSGASTQSPQPTQPAAPQFPPYNNFPNFPTIPQIPQESGQSPSFPQLPQLPQISNFPQFPPNVFPQGPSQAPPSNFPAPTNEDRGLNDEDTVSVESA